MCDSDNVAVRGFCDSWGYLVQGESILRRARVVSLWNETLIKDWRTLWGQELPFYFCQLAAYKAPPAEPGESGIATVVSCKPRR